MVLRRGRGTRLVVSVLTAAAALALAAWLYLATLHGRFWRADQRLDPAPPAPAAWPEIVAVIPARDEADVVGRAVASLLAQDYPGTVSVVLVDDRSTDGTAEAARNAAGGDTRLTVVLAPPLGPGWTGKLWAMNAGLARALALRPTARFVLLTDADIAHERSALARLVAKAEAERRDLVSLMVKLHCVGVWERLLIPAFVFFFQKLYPFPRVNDPRNRTAGAAGGCMLVRRTALERIGGLTPIKSELIDDCALARAIKPGGSIWLGLAEASASLRPYEGLGGIWRMVARTAFTQLRFSALLLAGTVLGMAVLYAAPPVAAVAGFISGYGMTAALGGVGWLLMAALYRPTGRLYGRPAWEAALLPVAALLYLLVTLSSALAHWRGRGGAWKGRTYGHPT